MVKYTFTFEPKYERKFQEVLSRLDASEYNIIENIRVADHKEGLDIRYVDRQAIVEMDPEAALTFRLGMKEVKIRRERTEEELAEEKAIHDQNTVKITIQVPPASQTP